MGLSVLSAETAGVFRKKGVKTCILKCMKIKDVLEALDKGADMVCSVYAGAGTLKELTG